MSAGLRLVDTLASWSGALRWGAARASRGLTVLMYHRVLPAAEAAEYPLRSLVITREAFERQVRWLARRTKVVTVREGMEMMRDGRIGGSKAPDGRPAVALTFDDGYVDNAVHAAPILEQHGVRGTFFVTTRFIEGMRFWFDLATRYCIDHARGTAPAPLVEATHAEAQQHVGTQETWLSWLKSMPAPRRDEVLAQLGATRTPAGCEPMTIEQVRGLAAAGHEVGGHTLTHPVLTRESAPTVARELTESKRILEGWTQHPVTGFCYPNGTWDEAVRQAVVDAGYTYATTTRRQLNMPTDDPFILGRRWIAPDKTSSGGRHCGPAYAAEVLGLHDYIRDKMGRPRGPTGNPPRRTPSPVRRAA